MTVTLFPEFEHAYDLVTLGAFVAVDGEYSLYVNKKGDKYHNLKARRLFVNGQLVEPAETERNAVANPVSDDEDSSDLPF